MRRMNKKGQPLGLSWWVWLVLLILLLILIAGFYSGLFNQAESQAGQALGAKSTKANVCAGIGGATETGFCYTFSYIEETNEYINCEDRIVMLDLVSSGAEIKHECNKDLVKASAIQLCLDSKKVKQRDWGKVKVAGNLCETWMGTEASCEKANECYKEFGQPPAGAEWRCQSGRCVGIEIQNSNNEIENAQLPPFLASQGEICTLFAETNDKVAFCEFKPISESEWVNCEDSRILGYLAESGVDLGVSCGDIEKVEADKACAKISQEIWNFVTVGRIKCDVWTAS